MNFIENESPQKLRGGFYTDPDIAYFLCRWAMENRPGRVLEPSCGDGAFLRSLLQLGYPDHLVAWELNEEEAAKARQHTSHPQPASIQVNAGDFLEWFVSSGEQAPRFDAVVGNPPFIRYQYWSPAQQLLAEQIFKRLGLPFTRHTNAWVPFVLASIRLLAPGGRLAMVIPSEILHIRHAQGLRRYLASQCSRVLMIDPQELWFGQSQQGVVLLLAQKRAFLNEHHAGIAVHPIRTRKELLACPAELIARVEFSPTEASGCKWTPLLLSKQERSLLDGVRAQPGIAQLGDLADIDVGIVTGANSFFLVPDTVVAENGLQPWAHPMFGRSEHVNGLIYDGADHEANRRDGLPANFLWFDEAAAETFPPSVQAYLRSGVDAGLPGRYKCRIREPWFRVPSVYASPVAMLKRAHHFPRLILNRLEAFTTDTAYRLRPRQASPVTLVHGFFNSLTFLSAELEGRHYGGGVLELVPSEIERLLVPTHAGTPADLECLDRRFRDSSQPESLLEDQNKMVLTPAGLSPTDCTLLHSAWDKLRNRRQRGSPPDPITADAHE